MTERKRPPAIEQAAIDRVPVAGSRATLLDMSSTPKIVSGAPS